MFARASFLSLLLWAGLAGATTDLPDAILIQPPPAVVTGFTYTVKKTDTLYRVARAHGTTADRLVELNALNSSTVEVGWVLQVPGPQLAAVEPPPPGSFGIPLAPGAQVGPAITSTANVPDAKVSANAARPMRLPVIGGRNLGTIAPPVVTHARFGVNTTVQRASTRDVLPDSAYLSGLSFAFQTFNNCGPAAISAILGYYGKDVSQDTIRKALRPRGGYMQVHVIDGYVRKYGLRASRFRSGSVESVKRLVGAGIPVIVLQWLDKPGHIPHFRVVRGFDDARQVVWISDSMYGSAAYVSYHDFDVLWNTQGRQFLPVYPQGYEPYVAQLMGVDGPI